MSNDVLREDAFSQWWNEVENFATRAERMDGESPEAIARAAFFAAFAASKPEPQAQATNKHTEHKGYTMAGDFMVGCICQMTPDQIEQQISAWAADKAGGEPNEADDLLRRLGLDPEQYRTDGGYINHMKVRAAILYPDDYPRLNQCAHQFVADANLGGRVCNLCGKPERIGRHQPQPLW